jgi:hypothetical protein
MSESPRPNTAPVGAKLKGKDLTAQLLNLSTVRRPPKWSVPQEERFREPRKGHTSLPPGYYKTQRQFVMNSMDEYNPKVVYSRYTYDYTFPHVGKDGYGGFDTFMGGNANMPHMGPGKYPAEQYQTTLGKKAHILSSTAKPAAYSFGKEEKFFELKSAQKYKRNLGPGSYSLPDGFKLGPSAEKAQKKALRDLKKYGQTPHANQIHIMTMRNNQRGPEYQGDESKLTKEQLKTVETMLKGAGIV